MIYIYRFFILLLYSFMIASGLVSMIEAGQVTGWAILTGILAIALGLVLIFAHSESPS